MNKFNLNNNQVNQNKKSRAKKVLLYTLLLIFISIIVVAIVDRTTVYNTYYKNQQNIDIPVFVYHNIVIDKKDIEYDYMQTDLETFKGQIEGIKSLGYNPTTIEKLNKYNKGEIPLQRFSFIITFDDGYEGIYTNLFPYVKETKLPIAVFINNDTMGTDGFLTWEQAKEMHDSGYVSIYSHGYSHIEYNRVENSKVIEETKKSMQEIKDKLDDQSILDVFCYPYGLYTESQLEDFKKEGFIICLTDNKINRSYDLRLEAIHRSYPLEDSYIKIVIKILYRLVRYGG